MRHGLAIFSIQYRLGEAGAFPNIAGAQGPADATKSYVAGAEVKDILLPVPQISTQWQITPSFSLLAYYQFAFEQNRLTAPGTYWSYSDVVGPGAQFIIGPGGINSSGVAKSPKDRMKVRKAPATRPGRSRGTVIFQNTRSSGPPHTLPASSTLESKRSSEALTVSITTGKNAST